MTALLMRLRTDTRDIHERLHRNEMMLKCLHGDLSLGEYVCVLNAFLEPSKWLINHLDLIEVADISPCLIRRHNRLLEDLEDMSTIDVDKESLAVGNTICQISEDFSCNNRDEAIGALYAITGSSLGAKTLRKAISAQLSDVPLRYLSTSPLDSGWPMLVNFLEQSSDFNEGAAVIGAKKVFSYINRFLLEAKRLGNRKMVLEFEVRANG